MTVGRSAAHRPCKTPPRLGRRRAEPRRWRV